MGTLGGFGLLTASSVRQSSGTGTETAEIDPDTVQTLVALAEVIYPSAVSIEDAFVRNYLTVLGASLREQIERAAGELDLAARSMTNTVFRSLTVQRRAAVLKNLGITRVYPRPTGPVSVRVRYYLCNGLLMALFTSPRGAMLFGIDNPPGYPGGYPGQDQVLGDR